MGWLRNFIRKNTKPIPQERALKATRILSTAYYFFAWHAVAYLIYKSFIEAHPKTEEEEKNPSKYYARLLRTGTAQVYKFSGTTLVEKYTIEGEPRVRKSFVDHQKEQKAAKEREDMELLAEGASIQ